MRVISPLTCITVLLILSEYIPVSLSPVPFIFPELVMLSPLFDTIPTELSLTFISAKISLVILAPVPSPYKPTEFAPRLILPSFIICPPSLAYNPADSSPKLIIPLFVILPVPPEDTAPIILES